MPAPRLYLVTPPVLAEESLGELAAMLDTFDIACVRVASASQADSDIRRAADLVRDLCHPRDVNIVLADHFRLVPELGLDGVHLTDGARTVREARKHLGADAIVGAFAKASRHDGMTAAEIGADYVSFGPVGDTPLGDGTRAPQDLFAWWSEMIETPVIAEGGLSPELAAIFAPHVDFLALGPELWTHPEGPQAALKAVVEQLPVD